MADDRHLEGLDACGVWQKEADRLVAHLSTLAYDDPITMAVFSWGRITSIPEDPATKPLKKKYFLNKFYGYIAVKK